MVVTVSDLLKHPFMDLPLPNQKLVVAFGRALPDKNLLKELQSKNIPESINLALFEQVPWLMCCENTKELYCYACLLFMPKSSRLTTGADIILNEILTMAKNHEVCEQHLNCALRLQIFICKNIKQPTPLRDKLGYNYEVIKNREILKIITDAVYCTVGQKLLDRDGKYTNNLISVEECKIYLNFLKNCYPIRAETVDGAVEKLNTNPQIVHQLVDAISNTMKMAIKNEIQKSTYISLMLSEHGSNNGKSQISLVLRYINRGKVCERFVGFNNFYGVKNCKEHLNSIINTLEEFGISNRFLSLSVDGNVSSGQPFATLFSSSMVAQFRYSYFVPWYSHGFGYVLLQSLSGIQECGVFLKMINGMQILFRNENILKSFEKFLSHNLPTNYKLSYLAWNFRSNFMIFACRYRRILIKFFKSLLCNSKCWNTNIISSATAFKSFLKGLHNVFLLLLFMAIFYDNFDQNFNFPLENGNLLLSSKFTIFKDKVGRLAFATVWRALEDEANHEGADSSLKFAFNDNSQRENCEVLFNTIIRHLYLEIESRTLHFPSLYFYDMFIVFCNVIRNMKFDFTKKNASLLKELMTEQGKLFFDITVLQIEMKAVQKNAVLRQKNVYELLEYLDNIRNAFPQVFKLAELVLTLPCLPAASNKSTSKLAVIDDFSYVPESSGTPSGEVSLICIEYELLKTLKHSTLFYEDILSRFFEVNKTLPLVQI